MSYIDIFRKGSFYTFLIGTWEKEEVSFWETIDLVRWFIPYRAERANPWIKNLMLIERLFSLALEQMRSKAGNPDVW
jgi:hypothetical protein